MYLREIVWKYVDYIEMAQDRGWWGAVVKVVINL
jgi:hypothetical protein